jgi:hypothetical protein
MLEQWFRRQRRAHSSFQCCVSKKYTRKRHWEGIAVKQGKNLGARGQSPSGGATLPRQQESRSKNSTEVEREWEKNEVAMKEEAQAI